MARRLAARACQACRDRDVHSGGGIEPDVKVDSDDSFTPVQSRLYPAVCLFVRELVSGRVADYQQFKLNGVTYDYRMKGNEYIINDDLLKRYRDYAVNFYKENPDYHITTAMIDQNLAASSHSRSPRFTTTCHWTSKAWGIT